MNVLLACMDVWSDCLSVHVLHIALIVNHLDIIFLLIFIHLMTITIKSQTPPSVARIRSPAPDLVAFTQLYSLHPILYLAPDPPACTRPCSSTRSCGGCSPGVCSNLCRPLSLFTEGFRLSGVSWQQTASLPCLTSVQ